MNMRNKLSEENRARVLPNNLNSLAKLGGREHFAPTSQLSSQVGLDKLALTCLHNDLNSIKDAFRDV
jgi:hypothetical protein